MYKVVNPIPKFHPFDVARVKKTGELVVIQEVNLNTSQTADKYQWSFSVEFLDPNGPCGKNAWYEMHELEYVNNLFQMFSDMVKHPFSDTAYKLRLKRRK